MAQYLGFCEPFAFDCFVISYDPSLYQFLHPLNEVSFSFFFLFLHVFHRQRSETQVVMQLGIDGFQLGFLLFFSLLPFTSSAEAGQY